MNSRASALDIVDIASERLAPGEAFDEVRAQLLHGRVEEGMDALYHYLADRRADLARDQWRDTIALLRQHPLHRLLLQSPFTGRAFRKPRGYAGDAPLMDLAYLCGPRPQGLTTLGEGLWAWEIESPGCRSVRHRRMRLARTIDSCASTRDQVNVVAFACGHLRELDASVAAQQGRVRVVALDQDAESLELVARDYGHLGVQTSTATVRDVLRGRRCERDADLCYAAGLYDYLDDKVAVALTAALFEYVRPGGRLLIANFTTSMRDAAYMEGCMDWHLIYRDEPEMIALTQRIAPRRLSDVHQYRDPSGNITYLQLTRL
jgi:extracellular factor (EF) 3-hydroxypalmitic acid methyl ester biosynthesis protein